MKKNDRSRKEKKFSKELALVLTVHSNEMSFSSSFICSAMLTTSLCMLENLRICSLKERKIGGGTPSVASF